MLVGRFLMIMPILALAGSLVRKKVTPLLERQEPFRSMAVTFFILLSGTILLVGALNFVPVPALWPGGRTLSDEWRKAVLIMKSSSRSLFEWKIVGPAIADSFRKLNPRWMIKNPVMFVTMVGAAMTTVGIFTAESDLRGFVAQLALWLWFTVLFANFAEAMAEGRGKAQAATLRRMRTTTMARRLVNGSEEKAPATDLNKGDRVVCEAGDVIPADGDVVEGIASGRCEAAITGESGPGDPGERRGSAAPSLAGTRVLGDRIRTSSR